MSVYSSVTVLEAITGPPGKETAAWMKVKKALQRIDEGVVPYKVYEQLNAQFAQYAELIEKTILANISAVSLRAVALVVCGLWAKEGDDFLDLSSPTPNPRVHLLLRLLLGSKHPLGFRV